MADTTNSSEWNPELPDNPPDPLGLIGRVIAGKYRIDSFIGEGGFGRVYTGSNLNLVQQKVVIKFFTQVRLEDRFDKEAKILCKLDHPGICSMIDYLPVERALVIPFIDGTDLNEQLKNHGPLSAEMFMKIALAMMEAIAYAHDKSIAHRDIKPSNIMIGKNGKVYLIDFGIAKEIKDNSTKTTFFLGTPDFAAPERRRNQPKYNPFVSDIYELGVTLYYLATRKYLYQDRDNPDYDDWNFPGPTVFSSAMKRVLKKATHPDPEKRYQTIAEMATDFRNIRYPYRRKSPLLRTAVLIVVILAILVGADALNQRYHLADISPMIPWMAAPDTIVTDIDTVPTMIPDQPVEEKPTPVVDTPVAATTPIEPPVESEPLIPRMMIKILPPGDVRVEVDGQLRTVNQFFPTAPGQHEIIVEHGDYPIYRTFTSFPADTASMTFDLREIYTSLDSTNIMLITLPRNDNYGFNLQCNGKAYRFDRPRQFDFYLKNGRWRISAEVIPLGQTDRPAPQVDSIVVGVAGKAITNVITGNEGLVNINSGPARDQMMRILIYWSETQGKAGR